MKKILFSLAILFLSATSFAYQQALNAGPPVGTSGMNVNINMTCSYVTLNASWSPSFGGLGNGGVQAYSNDATLIGEYSYYEGYNLRSYSAGVLTSRYWGSIQVYLSAFNCNATAILTWMP